MVPNNESQFGFEKKWHAIVLIIILWVFRLAFLAILLAGIALIVYLGITRPLEVTSGKTTVIHVGYQAILKARLEVIIPWTIAVFTVGLWVRERHISRTAIRREHKRVEECEKGKDPNRTSSGLKD